MNRFIFGITGPTGAGKSTVSDILRKKGVYIADADKIARTITDNCAECKNEIRTGFGEDVFQNDDKLNRAKLAHIVFNDENKLKLLNSITHKYIKERIYDEISACDNNIIGIDGAVIIGSPVETLCNMLVVVVADKDMRVDRIIARDNISYDEAINRVSSQMSNEEYEKHADFVIKNNDNVRLEESIEQLFNKIKILSETTIKKD